MIKKIIFIDIYYYKFLKKKNDKASSQKINKINYII